MQILKLSPIIVCGISRASAEYVASPDEMSHHSEVDGDSHHRMSLDDVTSAAVEVSVEDDAAAATDDDDDDDDNALCREFGNEDEEPAVSDAIDEHKQHDGVSLRIDDNDAVEKPGE